MNEVDVVKNIGSDGEHELQEKWNTTPRARAFHRHQVISYLNPSMQGFVTRQEMMFVGTADRQGEADTSFRAGLAGFVHVLTGSRHILDDLELLYELRQLAMGASQPEEPSVPVSLSSPPTSEQKAVCAYRGRFSSTRRC